MIHTIYKITNNISNKIYIGYTSKTVEHRFKQHCADNRKTILHDAIRGYGPDNFSVEAIYQSHDGEHTKNMEKIFIKEYDSIKNGYNMTEGGYGNPCFGNLNGMYGKKHSESTREKIRKKAIGRKMVFTETAKLKKVKIALENLKFAWAVPQPFLGMKHTEAAKKKMRCSRPSMVGNNNPSKQLVVREKIRQQKLGKKRPFAKRRVRNEDGILVWKINI